MWWFRAVIVTIPYRCVSRLLAIRDRLIAEAVPSGRSFGMGSKIVIIGGGIAGLTAAVALARVGLAAEVYEQAPALEEVGAGVGLWPNAMAALEPIGLSGKVAQLAAPVSRQGLIRPDGTWLLCIPGDLMARRWGSGFVAVHRAELQQTCVTPGPPRVDSLANPPGTRAEAPQIWRIARTPTGTLRSETA